jgi:glycosyltransferase involved in cell wall biosynthesis
VLSEAKGLLARGHDVKLLCPVEARIFAEAPGWGVPAFAVPIARKRPVGIKALMEWFRRNRPGVVNTHSSTDTWLSAFALLVLGRPFPLVRTRHISAPVPHNALSRWLYTRATARIVTTGEVLKRQLIQSNGIPATRIDSVPTGIDAARFAPGDKAQARAQSKLPLDKKLVGIVATLRSWKGHRYLIEAVAAMPQSIGLVIVGDGPQRDALEALVDKHSMRPRIWFAGNQADVIPWLQALDVFVLPSYANEGVPQALMQAMLVGLPCVTTHTGSIAELAKHEITALVVPPRDSKAIAAAVARLLADESLGKGLGAQAREHCSEHYSFDLMLDRMEAIYGQVSGRR